METNKRFLNFIKPFMTNEGMISSNDITLTDGKNVITDEYEISKAFNKHCINLGEKVAKTNLMKLVQHSGI